MVILHGGMGGSLANLYNPCGLCLFSIVMRDLVCTLFLPYFTMIKMYIKQLRLRFLKCACISIGTRRIDVDMCLSLERVVII